MTMNFIIVAKFFYNKYDRVFILLFAVGQIKEELLKSILNYFANIKINNHWMFYFYYFGYLKNV